MYVLLFIVAGIFTFLMLRRFIDKGSRSNVSRLLLVLACAFLLVTVSMCRMVK